MSPVLSAKIRHRLKRFLLAGISLVLSAAAIAYALDYGLFRYRVATNRQAFGQVTVTRYDAVLKKNDKTEFLFNPPEEQTCVHSLFPHAGYVPCWYLQRHAEQRTDI